MEGSVLKIASFLLFSSAYSPNSNYTGFQCRNTKPDQLKLFTYRKGQEDLRKRVSFPAPATSLQEYHICLSCLEREGSAYRGSLGLPECDSLPASYQGPATGGWRVACTVILSPSPQSGREGKTASVFAHLLRMKESHA